MRKAFGILFLVCVLLYSFFLTASALEFSDVDENAWYAEQVKYVSDHNLMVGVSAHQFGPQTKVTRAMFAQILYRMAGSPAAGEGKQFSDVTSSAWYYKAVRWATASGIMAGYGENRFGPDDSITREQLLTVLNRFTSDDDYVFDESVLLRFDDSRDVHDWARFAVCWGIENGIVSGSGKFMKPRSGATRAEVASILTRFCQGTYKLPDVVEATESYISTDRIDEGYVAVRYVGTTDKKLKVRVAKGDDLTYYVVEPNQEYRFCFPYGAGTYEVVLFENTTGTRYRRLIDKKIEVTDAEYEMSLVCPATYYNYEKVSGVNLTSSELWDSGKSDRENAKAVFDWVTKNLTYDTVRMNFVESGYLPDLSLVCEERKGLCLDYAAMYASMLRSQGVPCQIVVGYEGSSGSKQCHAWCRAYLDGEWVLIDPTFGSGRYASRYTYFDMNDRMMSHYQMDYVF